MLGLTVGLIDLIQTLRDCGDEAYFREFWKQAAEQ